MANNIYSDRAKPLGSYPHTKRVGDFIYISGTSSRRADNTIEGSERNDDGTTTGDIYIQTKAVIINIRTYLQKINLDLDSIIDVTSFLIDMKDFKEYNKAYSEFFSAKSGSTRTTIAVSELPHPELLIEIKAIAYVGA